MFLHYEMCTHYLLVGGLVLLVAVERVVALVVVLQLGEQRGRATRLQEVLQRHLQPLSIFRIVLNYVNHYT